MSRLRASLIGHLFAALLFSGCDGLFESGKETHGPQRPGVHNKGEGKASGRGKRGKNGKGRKDSPDCAEKAGGCERGKSRRDGPACESAADCVLADAPKSCCGCNKGGASIAIHKSRKEKYQNKLVEYRIRECQRRLCPQHFRCNEFKARCINSQCQASGIPP